MVKFCGTAFVETAVYVQLLQIDNTTAVAYINNMGGSKSTGRNQLAFSVWEWSTTKHIWPSAVHIAGILNVRADEKSREFSDKLEWKLNDLEFEHIVSSHPNINIDMFVSRLNHQLSTYCARRADPGSCCTDAFSFDWNNPNFMPFLLYFSLLPRCLQKIQQDNARGVLISPLWPTQIWFPLPPPAASSGSALGHPTEERPAQASVA